MNCDRGFVIPKHLLDVVTTALDDGKIFYLYRDPHQAMYPELYDKFEINGPDEPEEWERFSNVCLAALEGKMD